MYHFQTVTIAYAISGTLLRYCLYHSQTVPFAIVTTCILLSYCLYHFQAVLVAPFISGILSRYCLSHFQLVQIRPALTGVLVRYCLYYDQSFLSPLLLPECFSGTVCLISKQLHSHLLLPVFSSMIVSFPKVKFRPCYYWNVVLILSV